MSRYGWLTENLDASPITQGDLDQIENYADRIFAKLGIDVEFTRHFLDRVNDARNQKQISMAELTRLFKQQYKKNGKKIAQLGPGAEAVMKDMQTDVNMPFALVWDKQSQELDLIAKTVMRKKNFGTSNPVVAVENKIKKHPTEDGTYLLDYKGKEYKISKFYNDNLRHTGEWSIFVKDNGEWEWEDTVYSRNYALDRIRQMNEAWSKKYKSSIDCSNPKGFSQKAHCAGKKKKTEDVNEAFDNPYPINWFQKTQEAWEGSVQLPDGSKLFIDITESDEGYYAIEFAKSDTQGKGATMKATGTGDEFRIFATVQAGILEWWNSVDEDDVQKITFNASKHADDSKNRYKLYARFAKQWANKIGWVATSREEDGGISFVLMRPAAAKFAKDQDLEVMEDVVPTNDTEHAIERLKVVAKLCYKMGNQPILYRAMHTGTYRGGTKQNLIQKVDNPPRKGVMGNFNPIQLAVLEDLNIVSPAQATTVAPSSTSSYFGTNHIMIPGGDFTAYWNPDIDDLGGFKGYDPKYQRGAHDDKGGTLQRGKGREDLPDAEMQKILSGYQKGIPSYSQHKGEVILDTPFYYMLNLQSFLSMFGGKKVKELITVQNRSSFSPIKADLLASKFKTYSDIGWYLENPATNMLKWIASKEKIKSEGLVTELVTGTGNKEHLINRANKVADICATMGDRPLLYRQVRNTKGMYGDKALIIKATPRGIRDEKLLGSGNLMQPHVLNKIGIEHPVFSTMDPHPGTQGKFGANYFMVPIGSYKIYSSPQIKDLGTENSYNDKDRKMFAPASDEEVAKFNAVADTYKEGWPSAGFPNEVILDCEQYYMINVGEFVKKYAGEKARQMYTRDETSVNKIRNDINKELLTSRFKTYNDMAWYLRNPVTNLLKEDIDVNTQRGRLAYYLKQPQIKKGMAVHLGKLPKYHDGTDELADMVPDRAGVFALHPDAWESTFYSLTNKDFKKITFYKPAIVKIPPNSIVGDMAIANKFYRTNDAEEKQTHAEAYRDSIVPYGSDTSHIKMPEIIMPRLIESAGVGIVTKQNATKDVPIGGEYNNVKKVFPKMKHKQKHLTQVETLEEMFKKAKARVQEDVLEPITPQLSGYTKYTPTQLAIMEGGHTLEEEDPAVRKLRIKLKGQLDESISEELTEGFFSNLVVGTGIALAAFGAGSFFTKDISKPEVAKEIVVVQQTEVQPGDTIYSLARELKIDPKVLYKLNGYDHTTELQVGEKIKIPDFDVKPKSVKKIPTNFLDKQPIPKPKAEVVPITNKKLEKILLVVAKKSGLQEDELAAFMAQCAHESNQFRTLTEYGGSLDFRKYDPRYAPKKARALGNTKRGDGAKYKGRGYIQITGKYNYTVAGKAIGMDLVNKPELAAEPLIAAKIALWYWSKRVAPKVNDFTNTREVTKPINPGMRGLEQRIEYHDSYKKLAMASLSKGSEG